MKTAEARERLGCWKENTTPMERTMQSVQELELGSKWEATDLFVLILNQVLVLIERIWGRTMDHLLRKRLSDAHQALGELRDELEARQTARVA
jgi:hypothetical protein